MPNGPDNLTARQRIDAIHHTLRERICLLKYRPLALLREAQLAEEFGCSRTPIREAIKRLEFEGLVVSKNGVGTLVTEAEFEPLQDVYEMRLKVAELIGSMGVPQVPADIIMGMQELLHEATQLSPEHEQAMALAQINHRLHSFMCQLISNQALRQLYDLYYHQTIRIWYQQMPNFWVSEVHALVTELEQLITAAKRHDLVALGYVKRNFIARTIGCLQL
jgi:DNA-binding GntR family transcriptional regulator